MCLMIRLASVDPGKRPESILACNLLNSISLMEYALARSGKAALLLHEGLVVCTDLSLPSRQPAMLLAYPPGGGPERGSMWVGPGVSIAGPVPGGL